MESYRGAMGRWYCALLWSAATAPADKRWFIPCKSAQNAVDASVFLYAAHCSWMLTIQKYCQCPSLVLQIGCFGDDDLVQQWLQPLGEEQQVVEAKHKLHWNSCSVLQKLHAAFYKFQSTHHFVYVIRQAQVTRSCGKVLLKLVPTIIFPGICQ